MVEMPLEIISVTAITLAAMVALVAEKPPVDLTAIGIIVALMVFGLLTPVEAVAGFSHPAPLTVGALYVVSRGLERTGALDLVARQFVARSRGEDWRVLLWSLAMACGFSAFVSNTLVVIVFVPMVIIVCGRHGLSPSRYLMPISFASILAGTSTLIGTSTNILVSDLAAQLGHGAISMFELSRVGVPLALAGVPLLYLLARRLAPAHRAPIRDSADGVEPRYISELLLPEGSPLVGIEPRAGFATRYPEVEIYELMRDGEVFDPGTDAAVSAPGDILLVKASADDLAAILDSQVAALTEQEGRAGFRPYDNRALIVELIVPPTSDLIGRRLRQSALGVDPNIQLLGVRRRHVHFSWQKLSHLQLRAGDILLIQCPLDHLDQLRGQDVIVLENIEPQIIVRRRAPLAIALFVMMIAAATSGLLDILVASFTTAFLMLLFRCLRMREAQHAVDLRVLVLIIGTLALGTALVKTGGASFYARLFLQLFAGAGPTVVLASFIGLTSLLSHFISNNSTAALLVPVAAAVAEGLGVSSRPFIIGTCFGASACFGTPIGYQTNLLVYAPGGYRFSDFLRLGLPLDVFVCVGSALLIPRFWSF